MPCSRRGSRRCAATRRMRGAQATAVADRGRRGQRRTVHPDADEAPRRLPPPAHISGRDRSLRPDRGWLRGTGRAVAGARLRDRSNRVVRRHRHLGLAGPHRSFERPVRQALAVTGRRATDAASATEPPSPDPRRGSPPSTPRPGIGSSAASRTWPLEIRSLHGAADRAQRVGIVVRLMPRRVRSARGRRSGAVRPPDRVPRCRSQRLQRATPARSWPNIRSATRATR